jgi:hydrogenase maturation protease
LRNVTLDADYQINLEDALACAGHEVVVFIDAARRLRRPFAVMTVEPAAAVPAMSHTFGPGAVLALAAELYGKRPAALLLAVRGHDFSIGEGLTTRAQADLGLALIFLEAFLKGLRA